MYGGAKYPRIFNRGVQYFGGYKTSCDTGQIDPPGMEKVVYIVCAYSYTYTGYIRGY